MKKILFLLAAVCCGAGSVMAQDTIFKTDAQSVQAKILEISTTEVRYKRFSNPDGPTYVLPVSQISHIVYQNGERDDFNPAPAAAKPAVQPEVCPEPQNEAPAVTVLPQQPVQPAVAPAATPDAETDASGAPVTLLPKEERRVEIRPEDAARVAAAQHSEAPKIGEIYDDNGVRGIVISLDESGMHGLMLSLTESGNPRHLPWTVLRNPYPDTGATDKNDGQKNMDAVARYIAENSLSWDDFPAFKWCRDLGEGWYLPSIDELLLVGYRFNGGQRLKFDRKARQQFNNTLKDNGGSGVDRMEIYYSSTSTGDGVAATSTMEVEPPYVSSFKMHEKYLVRAVRKF